MARKKEAQGSQDQGARADPSSLKRFDELTFAQQAALTQLREAIEQNNIEKARGILSVMHENALFMQATSGDPVIRRTGLCPDSLLPPSRADDALLELKDVYCRRWLPRHGPRTARVIFAVQGAGVIWGFWSPRVTKWVLGVLGLQKLFGWFSGLHGG
jgi:hypothetical protein